MKKTIKSLIILIIMVFSININVQAEKYNGNCHNFDVGANNVELYQDIPSYDEKLGNTLYDWHRNSCNYYEDCYFNDSDAICYFTTNNNGNGNNNSNNETNTNSGGCSIYTPNLQPNLDPADKKRLIEDASQKCRSNGCSWRSSNNTCFDSIHSNNANSNGGDNSNTVSTDCNGIFGDFQDDLVKILNIFRILAPIIVAAFTVYEYLVAVINKYADALKKCNSRLVKRLILMAVLFLLPALINILLKLVGDNYGVCINTN